MFGGVLLELPSADAPAREMLEDIVRDALQRGPVTVAFSGGRDSSALLAVATHVARREGLDAPVPLTRVYPAELRESDEREWQEQVVRHLGLAEWERLAVPPDHLDVLGPVAQPLVHRFGPLWPPGCHQGAMLLPHATGSTLLTGEGGDAVFDRTRLSTMTRLRAGRERPSRAALRAVLRDLGPRATRGRRWRAGLASSTAWRDWLRPAASRAVLDGVVAEAIDEPAAWTTAMRYRLGRRRTTTGAGFTRALAAEAAVDLRTPFMDPRFLAALGADIHPWGFTSRGDAVHALFGDLLPQVVVRRTSKARFNRAVFGRYTRTFVRDWDGSGSLDDQLDPERLRDLASSPSTPAGVTSALQQAWLEAGAPTVDDDVGRSGTGT